MHRFAVDGSLVGVLILLVCSCGCRCCFYCCLQRSADLSFAGTHGIFVLFCFCFIFTSALVRGFWCRTFKAVQYTTPLAVVCTDDILFVCWLLPGQPGFADVRTDELVFWCLLLAAQPGFSCCSYRRPSFCVLVACCAAEAIIAVVGTDDLIFVCLLLAARPTKASHALFRVHVP